MASKSFTPYDMQKKKLEKLMENIDKPVHIPDRQETSRRKGFPDAPEFVRNVMGSSAGAGSGEFHVYRHLRRKEYARQKFIEDQARKEELDQEFQRRLEQKQRETEERTAKKRQKRLTKKQRQKDKKRNKTTLDDTTRSGGSRTEDEDYSDEDKSNEEGHPDKDCLEDSGEDKDTDDSSKADNVSSKTKDGDLPKKDDSND